MTGIDEAELLAILRQMLQNQEEMMEQLDRLIRSVEQVAYNIELK